MNLKNLAALIAAGMPWVNAIGDPVVDYSVISVPEERGLEFTCVTMPNDYVVMPQVFRKNDRISWLVNRVVNVSPDGKNIAFVSARDGKTNIFVKEVGKTAGTVQRTNRNRVLDFNYSPDGKQICFSEDRGNGYQIFTTDANSGFICRQLTSGGEDYSPVFSDDMKSVYFARQEEQDVSIWSCSIDNGGLSSYTVGMNPAPVKEKNGAASILCTRFNGDGNGEIWMFDAAKGTEKCIISDLDHSFSTPMLSPDGRWIVCVGSSDVPMDKSGKVVYRNTDIYVAKVDGTSLSQITFHAADDLSPAWSPDGKSIYFISQRGDAEGRANIWRIPFNGAAY